MQFVTMRLVQYKISKFDIIIQNFQCVLKCDVVYSIDHLNFKSGLIAVSLRIILPDMVPELKIKIYILVTGI